jgi:FkbM family methyltransferase
MLAIRSGKRLVQWSLAKMGYSLIRNDQFGLEALNDITHLCDRGSIKVILDIGANEGQSMLAFRRHFPDADIFCFEPNKQTFEILKAHSENNPRIKLYNYAIGSENTIATLFCNQDSQTNSLLKNSTEIEKFALAEQVRPIGTMDVQVQSLDTFCASNCLTTIDLLKIDSQGYEAHILDVAAGLLGEQRARLIYLEMLFVPYYEGQAFFEQVYCRLKAHNYKLVGLYNQTRHSDMSLMWCDMLFRR